MPGRTLLDKIWERHVVARLADGVDLLHIDGHILQESACAPAFAGLSERGLAVRHPELTIATIDHIVSTAPGRTGETYAEGAELVRLIREDTHREGVQLFDIGDRRQGIVHIAAPEQGFVLPGMTVVCADSHTPTSGALGALAWGTGTSETEHVLATQMLRQRKPKAMRVVFEGHLPPGVFAKDLVLHLISRVGITGGRGYAVEYAGSAISALSVEARMTICNMSIELGAKYGFIAPDEKTFAYLEDRPMAPSGEDWDAAMAYWKTLLSDPSAVFEKQVTIDCSTLSPQISWGITPEEVIGIDQCVPDPAATADPAERARIEDALAYQGLDPGSAIEGLPIDVAFIGSCTNARLSDLEVAAAIVKGRKVSAGVRALVVPGSGLVREAAESSGVADVFRDAGFEWREPGCSMCISINDDLVPPGQRCMATSNRNFENRQGPSARTHIASPASAAAAALAGAIVDVRAYLPPPGYTESAE